MDEIYEMEACKFDARSISMSLCGERARGSHLPLNHLGSHLPLNEGG
jgi:hypothetical protein